MRCFILALAGSAILAAPNAAHAQQINELRIDQPGGDNDEYLELIGTPGEVLRGVTWVVIGDDANVALASGVVEAAIDLSGLAFDTKGFLVVAEATFSLGAVNAQAELNFENSDNVTHLLVRDFTGAIGDDLDFDDDGQLDATPWSTELDRIALVEQPNPPTSTELHYGPPQIGPDGRFVPGHIFRCPDGGTWTVGAFALGADDTPGEANACREARPVTIAEIQGRDHRSPLVGQAVITEGVVTAVLERGFYMQSTQPDGDEATSEGLHVRPADLPTIVAGDRIEVAGTVAEFVPGGASSGNLSVTQLVSATVTVLSQNETLPMATVIGLGGRVPPTEVIDDDDLTVFDPDSDGVDFYETLEGMRVIVQDAQAVSPTNRFGEIFTLANRGAGATGLNTRGGITLSPADFNPERVQIQLDRTLTPGFLPQVNVGDRLGDVAGVVDYAFGNFEVKVTELFTVVAGGRTPEVTTLTAGADALTVASYNVLNLDPKVEDITLVGGQRDIDDDIGDGQFDRIAAQIAENLGAPDIVALQEIQDNDGAERTGVVDASLTYETLIGAIVQRGGPRYAYADRPPVDRADGGQPGGNIRVGFLYNPARVSLLGLERIEDQNLQDGDAFVDSRKSLAATFVFNLERFVVINNHWSSKGGSSPLFGQLQPPVNGRQDQREAQGQVVNDYVDAVLERDASAHVVVLGDLNEFQFLPPLATLIGAPPVLFNLTETLAETERYSYNFRGNSQSLDHILVSGSLQAGATFDSIHANSEFAAAASDHDPLIARLEVAELTSAALLPYFDRAVAQGELQGVGTWPQLQSLRLKIFRGKLAGAVRLSALGLRTIACVALKLAGARADGKGFPRDLIEGEGRAPLTLALTRLGQRQGCF